MFLKVVITVFSLMSHLAMADIVQTPFQKLISSGYSQIQPKISDANLKLKLHLIAKKQAQVWGDTILEGDYFSQGDTRLDEVVWLYKAGAHVGYLITYSETSWDISNCIYRESDPASLHNCLPGRIVESSYVSLDLKEYFYDEKTWARFKPKFK